MGDETETDLYVIADVAGHDLPDGNVIARNRRTGAQMPLPGEVFNAITYCDSFRTLEGQVAHLAGPNARGREGEIRQILQSVINGGMMLSAKQLAAGLKPAASVEANPPASVAVLTCDRPQALDRLLDSIVDRADFERLDGITVVDDSRDQASLSANAAAIETASAALQGRGFEAIRHFTPGDAAALVEQLVQKMPGQESTIRFLLDRRNRGNYVTTGISRNLAQLLAIGKPSLVFDDDVLCQVFESAERQPGVEFSARQRNCHFYRQAGDWSSLQATERTCPVSRHLDVLGRTLSESLAALRSAAPSASAFEFAKPGFAQRLGADSRVLVSQCGSLGDPGSGGAEWVALLAPEVRNSLFEIAGDLSQSTVARNCWLGRSRPVFGPRAVMSQLTGLDNTRYQPPYFPLHRGQDRIFGAMVEFIYPSSVVADLPFAIPHLPMPERAWSQGHGRFRLPFSLDHYLHDHVTGLVPVCKAGSAGVRNQWLSSEFLGLADADRERIVEGAAEQWTQQRIDWLKHLGNALSQAAGGQAAQVSFLQNSIRELQACNIRDFHNEPFAGPKGGPNGDAALDYWRGEWKQFGLGLQAWPAIREAVASLD